MAPKAAEGRHALSVPAEQITIRQGEECGNGPWRSQARSRPSVRDIRETRCEAADLESPSVRDDRETRQVAAALL
jgi:hypothetical protein